MIKNLTKCNMLSTFAFKNNGKFADHSLENCVLGRWPWPRMFCPQLHLCCTDVNKIFDEGTFEMTQPVNDDVTK